MADGMMAVRRWLVVLGIGLVLVPGLSARGDDGARTPTRVRFQLRCDCNCASCGFALQDQMRKVVGVSRVDLAARERVVTVTLDEERAPVSRVATVLAGCELGKGCALIGDLAGSVGSDVVAHAKVSGVRAASVDPKRRRLLLELTGDPPVTTAALTRSLGDAGVAVRFGISAPVGRTR